MQEVLHSMLVQPQSLFIILRLVLLCRLTGQIYSFLQKKQNKMVKNKSGSGFISNDFYLALVETIATILLIVTKKQVSEFGTAS